MLLDLELSWKCAVLNDVNEHKNKCLIEQEKMLLLTGIPMVKLSHFLQFINFIALEKSFVEISFKFSTVHYKNVNNYFI